MATRELAPTPFVQIPEVESAPQTGADFYFSKPSMMPRIYVPSYDTGIAIAPKLECICGRKHCRLDCHHNAFSGAYFEKAPGIRKESSRQKVAKFRSSIYNRFWVQRCVHRALQPTGRETSKRPRLEVIEEFLEETEMLTRLDNIGADIRKYSRRIENWTPQGDKRSLEYILEKDNEIRDRQQQELLAVASIRVIPEEVVTGALLYSAPEFARRRIAEKPDNRLVIPLNWPEDKVVEISRRMRNSSPLALQTGVDELQSEAA